MTIRLMLLTATALTLTACDNRNDAAANTAPEAIATATADADDKAIRLQVAKWLDLVKAKDAAGIAQLYTEDGAGMPPNVPSWGNIIAEGRNLFQVAPYIVIIPSLFLSATVLAVNLLGDGLRDALDPRLARQM